MLEKIKSIVAEKYDLNTKKGVFLSVFDGNKNLILSKGVLFTNKPLVEIITGLYKAYITKIETNKIGFIGIDIVTSTKQETEQQNIATINTVENGIYVYAEDTNTGGVILPKTQGIDNISTALQAIKDKNKIGEQAEIYSFTTEKIFC